MRVIHLHSGNQFGGIERLLVVLAHYGHDDPRLRHGVGLCFDDRLAAELRQEDVPVWPVGAARLSRPHSVLRARTVARKLLAQEMPDVVITHSPWARAVFGPVLRHASGRDVFWVHGVSLPPTWLERLAERYPPASIIYNSNFTARAGSARYAGVPSATVYCPVDTPPPNDSRSTVRSRYATDLTSVVIVHMGRPDPTKGQVDLIEAARLLPTGAPWVVWFVGGPRTVAQRRHHERLQELVGRAGLAPHVRFLGEGVDISSILHAADILCHPSRTGESFGMVFVEAMAAGIPVVATDVGAANEVVTPECGVLVPALDPHALADALIALAASPARRQEAGAAGRVRARALSDPRTRTSQLHDVLDAFLKRTD